MTKLQGALLALFAGATIIALARVPIRNCLEPRTGGAIVCKVA